MTTISDKDAIVPLPETERAAAIMHLIYIETIERPGVDWETRLASDWVDLDARAKAFNIAILDTWAKHPDLFRLWLATIEGKLAAAGSVMRSFPAPPPSQPSQGFGLAGCPSPFKREGTLEARLQILSAPTSPPP